MGRLENTKNNFFSGIVGQFIKIGAKFSLRTAIIYYFGAVYLGLDGLFINVISILSLAELGIGDAICYALYKPIEQQNYSSIGSYMNFYKNVYRIIGLVILILGLGMLPFIDNIVNITEDIDVNYSLIYILFLLNAVSSYLFGAYKQVIFIADQKSYVINNVANIQLIIQSLAQLIALVIIEDYYIYLGIMPVSNLLKNIVLSIKADEYYPFLKDANPKKLPNEKLKELAKNVYALAVTKISTTIYISSDNLVISTFIGTVIVGYYTNYAYIVTAISGIISILFSSVTASIGSVNAEDDSEKTHDVFLKMLMINQWIYGLCFVCLWQLLTPFVRLWTGDESFLLSNEQVILIVLMFLIPGLHHTCTIFRAACGLFWQTRYRTLATAILNVLISIILARLIGLSGIFLGTIISYLLTTFIVDPKVIYKYVFMKSVTEFYIWYLKSFLSIIAIAVVINFINLAININIILDLGIKLIVCIVVYNALFVLLYRNNKYFQYLYCVIRRLF